MNKETRDRLVLPLLLPLGILAVIAVLVLGFSRILLSLTPAAATTVALIAAIAVLAVGARLAVSTSVQWGGVAAMLGAVAGVALVAGGFAIAAVGGPEEEGEGEPQLPVVAIAAANIQFDTDTLTVPADRPFILRFANNDAGVPHNVAAYEEDVVENPGATIVFQGEIFNGVATMDYEIEPIAAGSYYFQCDVHPTMNGELIAEEGAVPPAEEPPAEEPPAEEPPAEEPPAEEPPAGVSVTVVAQAIAFDTAELTLPADTAVDLTLDNRDPDLHNLTIFSSPSGPEGEALFRFDAFPGPATQTHRIDPLPAGDYYFHCDVHPQMNGVARVG